MLLTRLPILLLVCLLRISAQADTVALLIGNNAYEHAAQLENPINDVDGIGRVLKKGGLASEVVTDASKEDMEDALDRLRVAAGKATVVMFYFAGHGIEVDGKNYLVPTGATLASSDSVLKETLSLDQVLARIGKCGTSSRIVVLDCCRDNPFADEKWLGSYKGGLARIDPATLPPDTAIVYSGAPGKSVPDGEGANSPFAAKVIENLVPGKSPLSIFTTVASTIEGGQKPWIKFDGEGQMFARLVLSPLMGQKLPEGVNLRLLTNYISTYNKEDPPENRGFSRSVLYQGISAQIKLIQSIAEAYFPADYFGSLGVSTYLRREMDLVANARNAELKARGESVPEFLATESAEAKSSELTDIWWEMARLVASRSLEGKALAAWLQANGIRVKGIEAER